MDFSWDLSRHARQFDFNVALRDVIPILDCKQRMIGERLGGLDEGLMSRDRRTLRRKIDDEPKIRTLFHDLETEAKYLSQDLTLGPRAHRAQIFSYDSTDTSISLSCFLSLLFDSVRSRNRFLSRLTAV